MREASLVNLFFYMVVFFAAAATATAADLHQGQPVDRHRQPRWLRPPSDSTVRTEVHQQQGAEQPRELALFQRPRSPVFQVPPGEELTMRQLYDCLAELVQACQSGGFADLLKVDTAGLSPREWQPAAGLVEQLRLRLFRAHREDQPDERLALCFIIKTPDIFDQSRPRQDPVCLHLDSGRFRMETDILLAQKTLCRSGKDSPTVHFLCSRPAPLATSVALTTATTSQMTIKTTSPWKAVVATAAPSSPKSTTLHRRASSSSSTSSRLEAEEKLKCALVWIVGVLLALIILLVAGILTHTMLHRRSGSGASYALTVAPRCFANEKTSLMEENGRCIGGGRIDEGRIDFSSADAASPSLPARRGECAM